MQRADESFDCESSDEEEQWNERSESPDTAVCESDAPTTQQEDACESSEEEDESEPADSEGEPSTPAVSAEDDDTPDWLVAAADECGLAPSPTETEPLTETPKKPALRLSELARTMKKSTGPMKKSGAARKVVFDPSVELAVARDEIEKLRRSNALQARYIETLKHKNEVLEQRLALRAFDDDI